MQWYEINGTNPWHEIHIFQEALLRCVRMHYGSVYQAGTRKAIGKSFIPGIW